MAIIKIPTRFFLWIFHLRFIIIMIIINPKKDAL